MISFQSPAFQNGDVIPVRYTQEGENVSPPLEWSGLNQDVKEFALVCEDPDAPGDRPFVHWILYGIAPGTTSLPESIARTPEAGIGAATPVRQGMNSMRQIGYAGPKPPDEDDFHHYHFRLYALNGPIDLAPGASREDFAAAIATRIIASAEFVALYKHGIEENADQALKAARRMAAGPEINDHGNKAYDAREVIDERR